MELNPIRSVVLMLIIIVATTLIIVVATSDEDKDKLSSSYRLHSILENTEEDEFDEENSYESYLQFRQDMDEKIVKMKYESLQEEILEQVEKEKEEQKKAEEEAAKLAQIEEEKRQQEAEQQAQRDKEVAEQERLAQFAAEEAAKEENASEQNEGFIEESEPVEEIAEDEEPVEAETSNTETYVVTAYTAGAESTDKNPGDVGYGVTASGNTVQEGHTIACPQELSFGTQIHIPSMGATYICEDRGADISSGRLDIYMSDLGQAQSFGRKEMEVEIK